LKIKRRNRQKNHKTKNISMRKKYLRYILVCTVDDPFLHDRKCFSIPISATKNYIIISKIDKNAM